jgi:hypothetical protein
MKKIKICNYEILNFEQDSLDCTSGGVTKKTNKGIFNVLKEIFKGKGQAVTKVEAKKNSQ